MKIRVLMLVTAALCTPLTAHGQASSPKALAEQGMVAYIKGGASDAVAAWLKGSALEGNTQSTSQANSLRQIEDFYGKPQSYEIVAMHNISSKVVMLVAVMHFQIGPLFIRMQIYQLASGAWVSTEFKFHTEAASILPPEMVFGQ